MKTHSQYWISRWRGTPPRVILPELLVEFVCEVVATYHTHVYVGKVDYAQLPIVHRESSGLMNLIHLNGLASNALKGDSLSFLEHVCHTNDSLMLSNIANDLTSRISTVLQLKPLDPGRVRFNGTYAVRILIRNTDTNTWSVERYSSRVYLAQGEVLDNQDLLKVVDTFHGYCRELTSIGTLSSGLH